MVIVSRLILPSHGIFCVCSLNHCVKCETYKKKPPAHIYGIFGFKSKLRLNNWLNNHWPILCQSQSWTYMKSMHTQKLHSHFNSWMWKKNHTHTYDIIKCGFHCFKWLLFQCSKPTDEQEKKKFIAMLGHNEIIRVKNSNKDIENSEAFASFLVN